MPNPIYRILWIILLSGCFLLLGCKQDDDANADLTLEQQLAREWQLDALRATVQIDGEDYKVFFAQLADSLGLAPEEIAIGLLLLEGQVTQEVLDRELTLNLQLDNLFELHQIDSAPLLGSWQLSQDNQQLLLTSEAADTLIFSIVAIDEKEMLLQMDEAVDFLDRIPLLSQQLDVELEMGWIINNLEDQ